LPDFTDFQAGLPVLAAILGSMVLITLGAGLASGRHRRQRAASNLAAIDFVRNSFASRLARGDPIDELLVQVVESLYDAFKLDSAELWLHHAGALRIAASSPPRAVAELNVTPAE